MTSLAPSEAKWTAMALPMPRDEPVTMATRSWSGREDRVVGLALLLVAMNDDKMLVIQW